MAEKLALISKRKSSKVPSTIGFVVLSIFLSACDFDPAQLSKSVWDLLTGATPSPSPSPLVSPSPLPSEFSSPAARASKENSELLHEVYQVVFIREPADRSTYVGLIEALNQGACSRVSTMVSRIHPNIENLNLPMLEQRPKH